MTPGSSFAFEASTLTSFACAHRTSQNARVRHARKLDIARIDRLAGDFLDAVDSVRVGARDGEIMLCLHDVD